MPRVQFSFPPRDINITKNMPTPTKMTQIDAWYKQARKVIPQIPDLSQTDWFIYDTTVTEATILFEVHDSIGNRAAIVIDRKHSQLVTQI